MLIHGEVLKQKSLLYQSIAGLVKKIEAQECSILLGGTGFHQLGWQDIFRILLLSLDDCERAYRNVVLNSAYHLNTRCSFAIPVYLSVLSEMLDKQYSKEKEKQFLDFLTHKTPERRSSLDIIGQWEHMIHDRVTFENFELIKSAVQQAGSLGAVIVTNTGDGSFTEIEEGCNFTVDLNTFFDPIVGESVTLQNSIVVIVEGMIVDVGEIHHLLSYAFENQQNVILLATGYSDDVSNTMAVNWKSGKLRVLPMVINQDLDNVNQLHDICMITSSVPVSTANGTLINNIEFSKLRKYSATFSFPKSLLTIQTSKHNITNIQHLRLEIQKKLEKEKVEDVINVLKNRLSRLSLRRVKINVKCSNDEIGVLQDRAAGLFQLLSRCASQGAINVAELYDLCCIGTQSRNYLPSILPFSDIDNAIKRAVSDARAIDSIRAIIKMEE